MYGAVETPQRWVFLSVSVKRSVYPQCRGKPLFLSKFFYKSNVNWYKSQINGRKERSVVLDETSSVLDYRASSEIGSGGRGVVDTIIQLTVLLRERKGWWCLGLWTSARVVGDSTGVGGVFEERRWLTRTLNMVDSDPFTLRPLPSLTRGSTVYPCLLGQ